ncbi:hypothetical protein Ancab_021586 [Ancistrocladus abbreviatus]
MYQMGSPESLPSSCGRKSSLKSSNNEDNNGSIENGRIIPASSEDSTFENNGLLMHKSSSPASKSQNQAHYTNHHHHNVNNNFSHFRPNNIPNSSQSPQQQNHHYNESVHHPSPSHSRGSGPVGGCGGGDVLLQWGQRKRSRCSRTEARSLSSVEKLVSNISMLPPPPPPPPPPPSLPSTSNSRGAGSGGAKLRPNGLLSGKHFLSGKNRNLEDPGGASPSKNGGSSRAIAVSRSTVGKRSNSSMDKTDKKNASAGSIRKEKSDDSNHHHHGEENGGVAHLVMPAGGGVDGEKGNGGGGEAVEWPRIYISLSRKEKEDDFYAMKGTKLPHRPKKRPKAIDRTLQYCFPGLWLSDLTRARYEVRERKSVKKQPKRRGLKGLESMDSDSD